ncbi:MAG: methyltransferase domain-containing protein [Vicinamibacterales bacterium]
MPAPAAPPRTLDALTSATLKHVRDEWWDDAFTDFLVERLRPRAGNRILDVGCGTGTAELRLSRLRLSQVTLVGLDRLAERTAIAERAADGHNMRASFAAADACHIPFPDGTFDSTFCVAVLQHIPEAAEALREFVRVTRRGGRILAVEPDNAARYWYSSAPAGMTAFAAARSFFDALAKSRDEAREPRVGPQLPTLFAGADVEPLEVELFPVSISRLGPPEPAIWTARNKAIEADIGTSTDPAVRAAGDELLRAIEEYRAAASSAGPGFVEIQSTLLFSVVGQRSS